jgi:predicted DNA-binding transcriptional regulator AlpA
MENAGSHRPDGPRRGLSRIEAAHYIGVSPTTFDVMVTDGRMPGPKRIGIRKVWDIERLARAFDVLPDDKAEANDTTWDDVDA